MICLYNPLDKTELDNPRADKENTIFVAVLRILSSLFLSEPPKTPVSALTMNSSINP